MGEAAIAARVTARATGLRVEGGRTIFDLVEVMLLVLPASVLIIIFEKCRGV